MDVRTITQPDVQMGSRIESLLSPENAYTRVVFVSAFTSLRTVLRIRERLLQLADNDVTVRLVIGIDLGGTSREVLEELLNWNCEVFVWHNPIVRSTFHPKIYLFESTASADLFIGSNNMTESGFYVNCEAAMHIHFDFPEDELKYAQNIDPIMQYIDPVGPTVRALNDELFNILIARGMIPSERDAYQRRRGRNTSDVEDHDNIPPNPFTPTSVPRPPLLPIELRRAMISSNTQEQSELDEEVSPSTDQPLPKGVLVWRKTLTRTDALQVRPGTHPVGGVLMTQADFESPPGNLIDHTTYFRQLFNDYDWEPEPRGHSDQEHTFVRIRVVIRGVDFGIKNFEISHKPSGEAGQDNYTTILRWGGGFTRTVMSENLTGTVFSLFETPDVDAGFFVEISDI